MRCRAPSSRPEDRVILKNKPSAFFATPLESFPRYDGVDTLVVCGGSNIGSVQGLAELPSGWKPEPVFASMK